MEPAIYFYTDGYCDQFGGEEKENLPVKDLKELLLSVQAMPMNESNILFLDYALKNWRQRRTADR